MSSTRAWSPAAHVIDGLFSTTDDLRALLDDLRTATGGPVIVAVFSGRWLLRSLSWARSEQGDEWAQEVIDSLEEDCRAQLSAATEKVPLVERLVASALDRLGLDGHRRLPHDQRRT